MSRILSYLLEFKLKDCSNFLSVPSISVSVNQENRNHVMFRKKRRFNRTDRLSRYEKNERAKRKTLRYHRYHPLRRTHRRWGWVSSYITNQEGTTARRAEFILKLSLTDQNEEMMWPEPKSSKNLRPLKRAEHLSFSKEKGIIWLVLESIQSLVGDEDAETFQG